MARGRGGQGGWGQGPNRRVTLNTEVASETPTTVDVSVVARVTQGNRPVADVPVQLLYRAQEYGSPQNTNDAGEARWVLEELPKDVRHWFEASATFHDGTVFVSPSERIPFQALSIKPHKLIVEQVGRGGSYRLTATVLSKEGKGIPNVLLRLLSVGKRQLLPPEDKHTNSRGECVWEILLGGDRDVTVSAPGTDLVSYQTRLFLTA